MTPIVELQAATKEFRGNPAFSDVDFQLQPGEIHALLGENGAGKSTLTKIIAGVYPLSRGKMFINGREEKLATPAEGLAKGIAMVYQENSLVPSMSVAQNIYLGKEKPLNRLRGIYISAQQFLQSLELSMSIPPPSWGRSGRRRNRWSRSRGRCTTRPRSSSSTSRPRR